MSERTASQTQSCSGIVAKKKETANTPDHDSKDRIPAWVVTFTLTIIFWPVGLLLLCWKMSVFTLPSKAPMKQPEENPDENADEAPDDPWDRYTSQTLELPLGEINAKKKKMKPGLEKKTGRAVLVALWIISIVLLILGANAMVTAARDMLRSSIDRWPELFAGLFYFIGGFVSFYSRKIGIKRYARYKRYFVFISGRFVVAVKDIVLAAGLSPRIVRRDLQAMINEGYLPETAYIDKELNCLILPEETMPEEDTDSVIHEAGTI